MSYSQAMVMQSLRVLRANGINLGNMNAALAAIVDALGYLVENTPERPK
jgi:hypothetical protein